MSNISLYDYDKISDDVCFLGQNVTLKFNVALSRKSGNNNSKSYFHNEYEFQSPYIDRERSVTIKRTFSYFFSIDIKTSFDSNIMIRPCDMIQMKMKLNKSLKWFDGSVFREKADATYKIIWDHEPIVIGKFLGGKYITLTPSLYDDKGGYIHPAVRMVFSDTDNYVDIEVNNYMAFVYCITSIDMYCAAMEMINYLPINAGRNHYIMDDDSLHGQPVDLTDHFHKDKITTSKPKKQNISYPKTSFFENKLAGGKNMIIDNPQGGERKK